MKVMESKGPSSLPCILARDGEDLGFMSLPMEKEGNECGEENSKDGITGERGGGVGGGGVGGGGAGGGGAGGGGAGGVVLRGGVWVLHERLLARWKERWVCWFDTTVHLQANQIYPLSKK